MTLRAATEAVEVRFAFFGVAHEDIERARGAAIGKRLTVQPRCNVGDVRREQSRHPTIFMISGTAQRNERLTPFFPAAADETLRLEASLQLQLIGSENQLAAVTAGMTKQPAKFTDPD